MEAPSLAKRLRPKTYSISLYLVGIVLVVQLVALLSVFYFRQVVRVDINPPPLPSVEKNTPTASAPVVPTETVTAVPQNPPDRITPVVPNPGRLAVAIAQDVTQRVKALNEEADRFQLQGELRLAAVALFKAESLDPKDPTTLVNLAKLSTVEKESERAHGYWQRVIDLGPDAAGSSYALAKEQLAALDAKQAATSPAPAPAATSSMALAARATSLATSSRALYVDRVDRTVESSSGLGSDFTLKISLGAGLVSGGIQPGKVDIKLYFYDQQASGAVVPSKAQLKVSFQGARQTWANGQKETLVASYHLTPELARIYNQKYYGYMLRIYYDGKLQDERAEPENLLKFFPAAK